MDGVFHGLAGMGSHFGRVDPTSSGDDGDAGPAAGAAAAAAAAAPAAPPPVPLDNAAAMMVGKWVCVPTLNV